MILDTLERMDRYAALNPRFAAAFDFLRRLGQAPSIGRHEIDGDVAFALVQQYETRPGAGGQLEAHRRYIDIQYMGQGREVIYWAPLTDLAVTIPYDATKDVAMFVAPADVLPVPIRAGQCMILYPEDAHAPCCTWGEPAEVLKVVLKVAVADPS